MLIDSAIERAVKRDRTIVLVALTAVVVLSWIYVLSGAGMGISAFEMTRMSGGGADIWDVADEFRFAYKRMSGNGSITVRVDAAVSRSAGLYGTGFE